ncbi:alpha/beta hydrolase [Sporosarcina sp. NCCP-2716]|uniref:alpha/beta hydrolase n=1 Tax=Sporosarcina sp. NCCP-2716 TaxID=2943679 RepID=UPI00203BB19C|nr:alpha/beta hydrolase [Sporosarcina sp. NCCP-2716]GKV67888.1 alpha/beta hydrolase [Sporosarcina sp. NCCP-2716]
MRKRFLAITGGVTALAAGAVSVFGILATNRLMFLKTKDAEVVLKRETIARRFDAHWYETVRKTVMRIPSPNGYLLHAVFLQPLDTTRTVIICHGVTENKVNSMKYARMFERLGFNSVVYDHRRHGESGGRTTSFGFYEKMDLQAIVTAVRDRIGKRAMLGIHGESMGAATMILTAGTYDEEADFYIADCPFSDFTDQVFHILKTTTPLRTPKVIRIANLFLKIRDGYTTSLVSPKQAVGRITRPMLFIHSLEDDFILPAMTEELYRLKEGPKAIKLFPRGAHARSFNENPEEYETAVRRFLRKYGLLN